ncbi:hypothetical protein [Rathayibacter tritici]|uniref:hypothetical protein n=1 Tax=Rathayibacter tritici TaxID=33888 RepID=UPI000B0C5E19|nr:hypothetical protein [Rathayibacter tritici]
MSTRVSEDPRSDEVAEGTALRLSSLARVEGAHLVAGDCPGTWPPQDLAARHEGRSVA